MSQHQIDHITKDARAKCTHLIVSARVRYWEDARINGIEDTDGTLIPFRRGDLWEATIELATGQFVGWPVGTVADIYYKVCDQGEYWLGGRSAEHVYKWRDDYVPDDLLCVGTRGYGDYILLRVGPDGTIIDWEPPQIDWEEWVLL